MTVLAGLVSFTVLLGHTLAVFEWNCDFNQYPLINNFFDGRSAVTMFFILSGFVLSFGYVMNPDKGLYLVAFYTRRITRIWMPWLVSFIVSHIVKIALNSLEL